MVYPGDSYIFPPQIQYSCFLLTTVKIVLPIIGFPQFEYIVPWYDFLHGYPISVPVYFSDL